MQGIILHPLRIAALDRMKVLRVPFREQPPDDSWFVGIDKRQEFAIFQAGATQYPVRLPYAPGEYFVKEAWQYVHFYQDPETGICDDWYHTGGDPEDELLDYPPVYRASKGWDEIDRKERGFPWRPAGRMPEKIARYLLTLGPPVPCRLGEVTEEMAIKEGVDDMGNGCGAVEIKDGKSYSTISACYQRLWNQMYPNHSYSPDRWTWGYPMEARRR